MARIQMEPMEIGNQMFALIDGRGDDATKMYVGALKEWVEVRLSIDPTTKEQLRTYVTEHDESVTRSLYFAYLAKNVEVNMDRYVAKHLKTRGVK